MNFLLVVNALWSSSVKDSNFTVDGIAANHFGWIFTALAVSSNTSENNRKHKLPKEPQTAKKIWD